MAICVILADDHKLIREGLRLILQGEPDVVVIAEASTGWEAIELSERLSPDVVVMDIAMADMNGLEATRHILSRNPDIKIIGLSAYDDRRYILGMLEAGARGYVLKSDAVNDLMRAIHAAMRNQRYLPPEIAAKLHISVRTVETHRRNISRKLGLHSVAELTKYAIREGLVRLEE